MIVFTDSDGRIKDVGITTDESLIEVEINDEENPFNGWTVAKICCYRVTVEDGFVTMMTPYVDSKTIPHIDQLAKQTEAIAPYKETKTAYFGESEKTFYNVPEGNITVYFNNYNGSYSVKRILDRVVISFNTLTESTNITISVN